MLHLQDTLYISFGKKFKRMLFQLKKLLLSKYDIRINN